MYAPKGMVFVAVLVWNRVRVSRKQRVGMYVRIYRFNSKLIRESSLVVGGSCSFVVFRSKATN